MVGAGTTRNEQLHREIKSWGRNIFQAHVDRINIGVSIFLMAKLLTHSSATYSPTLTQTSQQTLLSQIAGEIRVMNFFPKPVHDALVTNSVGSGTLHNPRVLPNIETAQLRRLKREEERMKWAKRNLSTRSNRTSNTNIFKRPRTNTRVRLNKNISNK